MVEKKEVIGKLQLIAASLVWGTSFMFVKTAQEEFQPFVLMALRLSIAAAVLGIVFIKKLKGLNRQYIWRGAILGFCLAGGMGLQAMGLNYMSPGTNAFLTASYCLFLPFFAWALTRKRPDIWKFCGSIICLAGIGLVSLENDLSIGEGSLITVSSGLMYAGQMACASVFVKGRDPMLLSIVQFFFAAIFGWIISVLTGGTIPDAGTGTWLQVLYLAVICTGGGYTLQCYGQRVVDPSVTGIIVTFEAVFAVVFSALFYGEDLSFRSIAGFTVIFAALLISETKLSFLRRKGKTKDGN